MPIDCRWFAGDLVMLAQARGKLAESDLHDWDTAALKLLNQSTADRVHMVFYNSGEEGLDTLTTIMRLGYPHHPRLGWIVVVNMPHPVQRFVMHITAQAAQARLRFVESFDEGIVFLQDVDDDLPDLLAIDPPELA